MSKITNPEDITVMSPALRTVDISEVPPPDELAVEWLQGYHGSIDSTALLLAFKAGYKAGKAAS